MLRRPPTRIELTVQDQEELEKVMKERGEKSKNAQPDRSKQSTEARIGLTKPNQQQH